MELAK
ncbi:hypothetical protein CP09DC78_1303, partial [Chlamydia psittaci 09DC78]|jgi:hypothetical protein